MNDCLFCNIIAGTVPANTVYEDERCLAFRDIAPQAPQHALLLPKAHVSSLNEVDALSEESMTDLLRALPKVAKALGIEDSGYRVVVNCGSHACQTVPHLHLHVMGGKQLSDKMA